MTLLLLPSLVTGRVSRARIRDSLRGRIAPVFVDDPCELFALLERDAAAIFGILVQASDCGGMSAAKVVTEVRVLMPHTAVVGYCLSMIGPAPEIAQLAAAGAHELVFEGLDEISSDLLSIVQSARRACGAEHVLAELHHVLPDSLLDFANFCVRYPTRACNVAEVASGMGVHRKTLVNYCARARVMPAGELLSWTKVLLAAHYLETTCATVESIAFELDIPSAGGLRNMLRRYTSFRPRDLRMLGGLARVQARFVCALADSRPKATIFSAPPSTRELQPAIAKRA